jgi:hypothetical protein
LFYGRRQISTRLFLGNGCLFGGGVIGRLYRERLFYGLFNFVGKSAGNCGFGDNDAGAGEDILVFKGFLDWTDYVFRLL